MRGETASDIDASYHGSSSIAPQKAGGQKVRIGRCSKSEREGEACCRVSRSTMGQLVVTKCEKRQDTGYNIHVGSKVMTTMHIRRNRGIVEKGEVKGIRLVSLSGMKFYPNSLQLVRRLCDADSSAHSQSQIKEEDEAGKVTKGRVYSSKVTFGCFSGKFDK